MTRITRIALPPLAALTLLLAWGQTVYALPDGDPCVQAKADLEVALAAVLDLSPDLLGTTDTVEELTTPVLTALKVNPLAGEGAQAVIQAAIDAQAAVTAACVETPEPTPTPVPPTPVPTPEPVPADVDPPFESCDEAEAAGVDLPILAGSPAYSANLDLDSDGLACEQPVDGFDQVGEVPQGGIQTGGWPS